MEDWMKVEVLALEFFLFMAPLCNKNETVNGNKGNLHANKKLQGNCSFATAAY